MDTDAHNRNREILETMIPRESPSRRIDFATFISISFPAFSLSNGTEHLAHKLYNKTKKDILTHLSSVSLKNGKISIIASKIDYSLRVNELFFKSYEIKEKIVISVGWRLWI